MSDVDLVLSQGIRYEDLYNQYRIYRELYNITRHDWLRMLDLPVCYTYLRCLDKKFTPSSRSRSGKLLIARMTDFWTTNQIPCKTSTDGEIMTDYFLENYDCLINSGIRNLQYTPEGIRVLIAPNINWTKDTLSEILSPILQLLNMNIIDVGYEIYL